MDRAHAWHRRLYDGAHGIPRASHLGNPRDSDPEVPDLIGYDVAIGARGHAIAFGVPSSKVPSALDDLEAAATRAVGHLDAHIAGSVEDVEELRAVLLLSATLHGEWVRIHPYANGNGRTARVWANWIAMRYGLPPFVRVRPRPDDVEYGRATLASMRGDHDPTAVLFAHLLRRAQVAGAGDETL